MASIFSKIVKGEIPSYKVAEDEYYYAFLDINPLQKGHTLVIPKSHSDNLLSVEPDTAAKALKVISKTANAIKEALGCDGINVVQNNGEAAGQTVMHLHFHIIPRYKNDSVNIGWQPMKPSNEELAATAALIKEKMN